MLFLYKTRDDTVTQGSDLRWDTLLNVLKELLLGARKSLTAFQ